MYIESCPMSLSMRTVALLRNRSLVLAPASVLGIGLSVAFPVSLLAQAGSTGGSVGKAEKPVTGTSDETAQPDRQKSPRSAPVRPRGELNRVWL